MSHVLSRSARRGGVVVSGLDCGSEDPGSIPGVVA